MVLSCTQQTSLSAVLSVSISVRGPSWILDSNSYCHLVRRDDYRIRSGQRTRYVCVPCNFLASGQHARLQLQSRFRSWNHTSHLLPDFSWCLIYFSRWVNLHSGTLDKHYHQSWWIHNRFCLNYYTHVPSGVKDLLFTQILLNRCDWINSALLWKRQWDKEMQDFKCSF